MPSYLAALDARLMDAASTGDTSYWLGLARGFCELKDDFRLLLLSNTPRSELIPEDPRLEWRVVESPHPRLWSLVSFPTAARRAGALATHTQYTLSPLAKGGITTIHDLSFLIGPQWFQPKDRFLMSRTVPASVRRARAVLSVSETTKADLERLIPSSKGKITVTPNALGQNIRFMSPEESAARRRAMGVEGPYVLSVSTRWPRKNMELAVRAVDLLPSSLPHRLVLTGKSGWGDQSKGSRTQAVGYVTDEDLSALYLGASAYLCPSLYEGFGIPLLEAMFCGCPVICSSGGALPEVANGAARVMESWDPADWAASLAELLMRPDESARLVEAGRRRVRDYSWTETARKTLEVYRAVGRA